MHDIAIGTSLKVSSANGPLVLINHAFPGCSLLQYGVVSVWVMHSRDVPAFNEVMPPIRGQYRLVIACEGVSQFLCSRPQLVAVAEEGFFPPGML